MDGQGESVTYLLGCPGRTVSHQACQMNSLAWRVDSSP